jgi:UDPglucose 6-dehydrogenase
MENTSHRENITVIGIGRLGICLALCLEKAGYNVLGVDISPEYIAQVNDKTFASPEPRVTKYLQASKQFKATTSIQEGLDFSDLYFIVAPTNTVPDIQAYDHSIISKILTTIDSYKVSQKHIVICATVFPGYIINSACKFVTNCPNTSISYNPEFIAQGDIINGLCNPDMVLIGEGSKSAGDRLETIYKNLCLNHPYIARMSVPSAEITKLAVNCFVTAKIAFANLIGDIADKTPGADKEIITRAIGQDQRIGPKNLKPGYGYGGPCFPRDNRALGNYASLVGVDPLFFRATDQTNDLHATTMAKKMIQQNLNNYEFEDVCYKSNCKVPIIENSQKINVAQKIAKEGKTVTIIDTEQVIKKVQEEFGNLFNYIKK